MSIGERLRYARDRVGLTGSQVRERTQIGESSLSEFENGIREPKLSQLHALAKVYHRSVSFFLADEPIAQETMLWRVKPAEGAEETEAQFLRLCEQYNNLETWCDEPVPCCLPMEESEAEEYGYAEAESLAGRVRRDLQLSDHPGPELLRMLEETCGVKIFFRRFEPAGSAVSMSSESYGCAILLNMANVRWRRNFDLAHELFHLLTWDVFHSDQSSSSEASAKEEKLATCFARNLLMPGDALRDAVNRHMVNGSVPFEAWFDIARLFDVSVEALLWQRHMVYNFGREKKEETEALIKKAMALAPFLEDRPRTNTDAPELPDRYRALAIKALRHGNISTGRFAEYLGISRWEALKYVEQEVVDGEETEVTPA